jgi:hypothetical protein
VKSRAVGYQELTVRHTEVAARCACRGGVADRRAVNAARLLPMPQAVLLVPSRIRQPTLILYPALLCWPLPEAIRVVSGLRQRRLPSAFDLVLNQLKQLRFGLSGPVLPLFDRSLECADAIFGRL